MSREQGSRNVSLGPYRSTEIALEDRLTNKEAKGLSSDIAKKGFGIINNHDFSFGQLEGLMEVLGYHQEANCLYIRQESLGEKFVYLSAAPENGIMLVSGDYRECSINVLGNIEVINSLYKYWFDNKNSMNRAALKSIFAGIVCGYFGFLGLIHNSAEPIGDIYAILGIIPAMTIMASPFIKAEYQYSSRVAKIASSFSRDISKYSFGEAVYRQIMEEYQAKAIASLSAKKLESSEIKQLPEKEEKKKWAENQIGPETFVVSEETVKYFEKPDSERGVETAPEFKGSAKIEVLKK